MSQLSLDATSVTDQGAQSLRFDDGAKIVESLWRSSSPTSPPPPVLLGVDACPVRIEGIMYFPVLGGRQLIAGLEDYDALR